MPRSRVANTSRIYEYNRDIWVVSLVVYSPTEKSLHTKIVVEGLTAEGSLYYNESHIGTRVNPEEFQHCSTSLGLNNIQGKYIVICMDYPEYREDKLEEYQSGSKRSWSISRQRALTMLTEIRRENDEINQILQQANQLEADGHVEEAIQAREDLPNYQYAGETRGEFMGGNDGHNCLTWCEEKLTFADIHLVSAPFDGLKASPKKHTHPLKESRDTTTQDQIPLGEVAIEPPAAVQSHTTGLLPVAVLGIAGLIVGLSLWKPEAAKNIFSSFTSRFSSGAP